MIKRIGKRTLALENRPYLLGHAAAVGKKEGEGPLGERFDYVAKNDRMGQRSWELAESELQKTAIRLALRKATLPERSLDLILAGDLLNQCIGSFLASVGSDVFSVHARECALSRAVRCMLDDGTGSCARRLSGRERRGRPPACGSFLAFLLGGAAVPFSAGLRRAAHTNRTMDDYCGRRGYSRQCAGAERRGAVRCARDTCPVRQNGRNGRQGRGQHGCGDGTRRCEFRPIHFSAR